MRISVSHLNHDPSNRNRTTQTKINTNTHTHSFAYVCNPVPLPSRYRVCALFCFCVFKCCSVVALFSLFAKIKTNTLLPLARTHTHTHTHTHTLTFSLSSCHSGALFVLTKRLLFLAVLCVVSKLLYDFPFLYADVLFATVLFAFCFIFMSELSCFWKLYCHFLCTLAVCFVWLFYYFVLLFCTFEMIRVLTRNKKKWS